MAEDRNDNMIADPIITLVIRCVIIWLPNSNIVRLVI